MYKSEQPEHDVGSLLVDGWAEDLTQNTHTHAGATKSKIYSSVEITSVMFFSSSRRASARGTWKGYSDFGTVGLGLDSGWVSHDCHLQPFLPRAQFGVAMCAAQIIKQTERENKLERVGKHRERDCIFHSCTNSRQPTTTSTCEDAVQLGASVC